MTNNNGNNNGNNGNNGDDLAKRLADAMLAALRSSTPQAPQRITADRDPWEGIRLTPRQDDALIQLGWKAAGWRTVSESAQKSGPVGKYRSGPRQPQLATAAHDPEGLVNYQCRGMICARLAQYGRVHIGDVAIIINTLGCKQYGSSSELIANIKQTLGKRPVIRTADGFIETNLGNERQTLHDVFIAMVDEIMKAK